MNEVVKVANGVRIGLGPYKTPARGIYLCSSSTPPGGGVHGMCGFFAAQSVRRDLEAKPRLAG
jgi:phytoene dehydrogenase-like protein